MRTYIAYPPLGRVTGGMAVLVRLAAHLTAIGYPVALVPRELDAGTRAAVEGMSAGTVPLVPWDEAAPTAEDVWLTPEGWPALLLPGLRARAHVVIYVQNWAYLLGSLPQNIDIRTLQVQLLAVSQPVAWHAAQHTGVACSILRPGIDLTLFHPAGRDDDGAPLAAHTVRIAWMPRKNKALAGQIQEMFMARRALHGAPGHVEWVSIHQLPQEAVARTLRTCHIFLATGFPEGCPLPPLEAMASGCLVVGFGGFGGWDYMRQAWPGGVTPWWPQRPVAETPWGGNGFYAADADTIAAAVALEYAEALLRRGGDELAAVRAAARQTAHAYRLDAQRDAARVVWSSFFPCGGAE